MMETKKRSPTIYIVHGGFTNRDKAIAAMKSHIKIFGATSIGVAERNSYKMD